ADPQLIQGERDIALPNNVGITIAKCSMDGKQPTGLPGAGPDFDIIFNPSGGLAANAWGTDKVILYVRDTALPDDPTKGSPSLICIYVRTGLIAAHPVDPTA